MITKWFTCIYIQGCMSSHFKHLYPYFPVKSFFLSVYLPKVSNALSISRFWKPMQDGLGADAEQQLLQAIFSFKDL